MNSDRTTRTFTFDTTDPVHLTVIAHEADLEITHDAAPGRVEIEVVADEPSYLDESVSAEQKGDRVEVTIPPLLTTGKGKGFALQIGRTSVRFGHTASVTASISVPSDAILDLDGKSGDITIKGQPGPIRARTTSGDLTMQTCTGGEIDTGSGAVSIDEATGHLRVKTGSGEIRLEALAGTGELTSGSGDIEVGRLTAGSVTARTGSADITIGAKRSLPLWHDASTATGDLNIQLDPRGEPAPGQPHLEIRVSSGSGDVTLIDA
ncbi:DUF4097 family beta strand repeat-containing protein [Luteococcus sp. H138]|uniref:DUF4097 family beta strand repeat-containing protein n=1 Tax=unclassified Luteococcus TaxID=2639923 RepID=UPI00313D4D17